MSVADNGHAIKKLPLRLLVVTTDVARSMLRFFSAPQCLPPLSLGPYAQKLSALNFLEEATPEEYRCPLSLSIMSDPIDLTMMKLLNDLNVVGLLIG